MRNLVWVTVLGVAACGGGKRAQSFRDGMEIVCASKGGVENAEAKEVVAKLASAGPAERRQILADATTRAGIRQCGLLDPVATPSTLTPDAAPPAPDADPRPPDMTAG